MMGSRSSKRSVFGTNKKTNNTGVDGRLNLNEIAMQSEYQIVVDVRIINLFYFNADKPQHDQRRYSLNDLSFREFELAISFWCSKKVLHLLVCLSRKLCCFQQPIRTLKCCQSTSATDNLLLRILYYQCSDWDASTPSPISFDKHISHHWC